MLGNEEDEAQESGYDKLLREMGDQSRKQLGGSDYLSSKIPQNQAAETLRLGLQSGLPLDTVFRNLEQTKQDQTRLPAGEYERLLKDAPATANFAKDPYRLAAARDDLATIERIEQLSKQLATPVYKPVSDFEAVKIIVPEAKRRAAEDFAKQAQYQPTAEQLATGAFQAPQQRALVDIEDEYGAQMLKEFRRNEKFMSGDTSKTSFLDRASAAMSVGAQRGGQTRELGDLGYRMATEGGSPALQKAVERLEADMASEPQGADFASRWLFPFAKLLGQMAGSTVSASKYGATGAVMGSALPGVGTAAGAGLGFAAGMAEDSFVTEGGNAYIELGKITGPNGEKIDENVKKSAALLVGTVNAGLEMVGLKFFAAPFKAVAKRLIVDSVKDAVLVPTAKRALLAAGKEWAKTVASETATEVLQEGVNILGEEAAKAASSGEFEGAKRADVVARLTGILSETLRGTALMGIPGPVTNMALSRRNAQHAQETLKEIDKALGQTKLMESNPQEVEKIINETVKDTKGEFLYVQAGPYAEYLQSKNIDPVQRTADLTGSGEQMSKAIEAGGDGDIQIPLAKYAAMDEAERAFMQNEARRDASDMSARETEELVKLAENVQKQEEAARIKAEKTAEQKAKDEVFAAGAARVREVIERAVSEAGFKREAKTYGQFIEAAFKRFGQRSGVDPFELFKEYGLEVQTQPTPQPTTERVLEQPNEPKAPRGRIRIGKNRSMSIDLFEGKDRSTVLHEVGHFYLETLGDLTERIGAPADIKEDFQTIKDWLGVKDRSEITTEQHERWAKGFEQYLMEGKAPSKELRKAFFRFREWLTAIYREMKDYFTDVNLTDDVRGVMDRLLASEDQIEAAQAEQAAVALIPDVEKAVQDGVLTVEQGAKYAKAIKESQDATKDRFTKRVMADVLREEQKWWHDEREKLLPDIAAEVDARLDVKAFSNLYGGTMPDGSPLREGSEALKLSLAQVERLFGKDSAKALPKRMFSRDRGVDVNLAGPMLGFDSGKALIDAMAGLSEPGTIEEARLREEVSALEAGKAEFDAARESLESEAEAAKDELRAGKAALASKLEAVMRAEERAKLKDISDILSDIRERGGVRPTNATQRLPGAFRAKGDAGVGSGVLAQELADRGIIEDAYSDDLYDFLNAAVELQKESKERAKDFAKEARKIARTRVSSAIEALIENTRQREEILSAINGSKKAIASVKANVQSPRLSLINRMADERMQKLHGEPMTQQEAKLEAESALHGEDRAKILRMELEFLASENPATLKGLHRAVSRRMPSQENIRNDAEKAIGRLDVEAIVPTMWAMAERRAAKGALTLLNKGDIGGAFNAKMRELVNHERYLAAKNARESVKDKLKDWRKFNKNDATLSKSRDADLVNAGRAILASYEIGNYDKRAGTYLKQLQKYDPDVYQAVNALVEQATDNAKHYKKVTYDQFKEMATAVDSLWDLAKNTRTMEIEGKKVDLEEIRTALTARLKELGQKYKKLGEHEALSKLDDAKIGLLGLKAALRRVESWADAMGAPFKKYIWRPINDAVATYREERIKNIRKYLEIVKTAKDAFDTKPIEARFGDQTYTFKNKAELLGALLHRGNESNLTKLLVGNGWGEVDGGGNLDASKWRQFEQKMWKDGILTKADYDFVQSIWDLFEELKEPAQKAHKQMFGHFFKEITHDSFQTPWGEYQGGYVPAKADPSKVSKAATAAERALESGFNAGYTFPSTYMGFTQARAAGYNKPLTMNLKMIPAHIDEVLRFSHIKPRVNELLRVLKNDEFASELDGYDPKAITGMLIPWMDRTVKQKTEQAGWVPLFDKAWRMIRRNTGMQYMFANVSNALQNFTGLFVAASKVNKRSLMSALWQYVGSPAQTSRDVMKKSKFMRHTLDAQVQDMLVDIEEITTNPNTFQKVKSFIDKHGQFAQKLIQNPVNIVTWVGAYDQAIASDKNITEGEAVQRADEAVRLTQGAFGAEHMARYEAGTPMVKAITMFTSYFNMKANLMGTEFSKAARQETGFTGKSARMLYIYLMTLAIPAAVAKAISKSMRGDWDGDDDDGYLDDVMEVLFLSQAQEALAMAPGVGQLGNVAINRFNNNPFDDRLTASPAISALERVVKVDGRNARDVFTLIGILSGLPLAPAGKAVDYVLDEK